jgi:hypothetical protein
LKVGRIEEYLSGWCQKEKPDAERYFEWETRMVRSPASTGNICFSAPSAMAHHSLQVSLYGIYVVSFFFRKIFVQLRFERRKVQK